jgi:uncharacterized phage protein (TIGR02220 family)
MAEVNRFRSEAGVGGVGFSVEANGRHLHARHVESGVEAVLAVVGRKARAWLARPSMVTYFRPKTLFGPENFAEYVREPADVEAVAKGAAGLAEVDRARAARGAFLCPGCRVRWCESGRGDVCGECRKSEEGGR